MKSLFTFCIAIVVALKLEPFQDKKKKLFPENMKTLMLKAAANSRANLYNKKKSCRKHFLINQSPHIVYREMQSY